MKGKKLLALLLALVLTFALCGGALAVEQDLSGQIVILHTNDVHGAVTGYAKVAALKDAYEARGAYVLLMDAGDFSQGTTYVSISSGASAVELMNAAGYDVATVGNHEFDYGYANLKTIFADAKFKVVCANIKDNGVLAFDANTVFEAPDGTKIGVFGLDTPETASKANPAKIVGVTFTDVVAAAEAQVAALTAEGCDYIVCLGHLGVDDESVGHQSVDVIKAVDGIDLFVDGHSHTVIDGDDNKFETGDTMLVSTGTAFANIGVVTINGGKMTSELVAVTDDMAADETVAAATKVLTDAINEQLSAIVANSTVDLDGNRAPGVRTQETNLGDFATDAMLWFTNKEMGGTVDAALTNGGGIRATIPAGDISMNTMKTVFPFGNTVVTLKVTGAQLLEMLEASTYCTPTAVGGFPQVSGIEFTVVTSKDYDKGELYGTTTYYAPASINRVTITSVGGEKFNANAVYTIATNDFTAAGGDTYYVFSLDKVQSTLVDTGVYLEDVLTRYATEELGGVIGEAYAKPAGRINIVTFADVAAGAWYVDPVQYCYDNEYVIGYNGKFDPEAQLTFAQFYTILYRFANAEEMIGEYATTGDDWMAGAKAAAELLKIEVADWTAEMSRADVAVAAAAYVRAYAASAKLNVTEDDVTAFTDCVASAAVEDIEFLHAAGVLQGYGDGTYLPGNGIKRSETAKIVYYLATAVTYTDAALAA